MAHGKWSCGSGKMQPPMSDERLFAVRGAVQADANEAEAILGATTELMRELLGRNELGPESIVSCLFTTTGDLDAEFPAVAARGLGLESVPLLCCREIPVPGSLPKCIRLLVHAYTSRTRAEIKHCYLRGATVLRPDRA